MTGVRGLAAQRNAALDALDGIEVVAFFDDDALIRPDYLAKALRFLDTHPDVLGLTGRVLLDGARSGEIDRAVAEEALARSATEPTLRWRPTRELYGCNFVVRIGRVPHLRFDPALPLYSWLEDHDFARRLMRLGSLAQVDDCVIVHRAAASGGRQSHVRLGYSQVMNPVYLMRKGSFPLWLTAHADLPTGRQEHRLLGGGPIGGVAATAVAGERHGSAGHCAWPDLARPDP